MKSGDKVSPGILGMKVIETNEVDNTVLVEFGQIDPDTNEFVKCRCWIPASELTTTPPISQN